MRYLPLLIIFMLIPSAEGHQLFNADAHRIGGYIVQVSTEPEIPTPKTPSKLLISILDSEGNDVVDAITTIKILRDEMLLYSFGPRVLTNGHFALDYEFPEQGQYIVDVIIHTTSGNDISTKFNISIIKTFGYIFLSMVIIGVITPAVILAGIFYYKKRTIH